VVYRLTSREGGVTLPDDVADAARRRQERITTVPT
jgi:hypothetical protein